MPDTDTTIATVKEAVAQFARERDWEQFHAPKNLSMAIAAETAELMEHFLWCTPEQSHELMRDPEKRAKAGEELSDIIILAVQFANISGIDIATAIEAKLAQNNAKYPVAKAKGRALKYTEL